MTTTSGSPPGASQRFLQLADVAEILNASSAQVYALVRSGELPAIKIGGRGQWRVEAAELEKYIARMYKQTRDFVSTHQFGRSASPPRDDDSDQPDSDQPDSDNRNNADRHNADRDNADRDNARTTTSRTTDKGARG